MKKVFQEPRLEVCTFDVEDVITTSEVIPSEGIELPDHEWD